MGGMTAERAWIVRSAGVHPLGLSLAVRQPENDSPMQPTVLPGFSGHRGALGRRPGGRFLELSSHGCKHGSTEGERSMEERHVEEGSGTP